MQYLLFLSVQATALKLTVQETVQTNLIWKAKETDD